MVSGADAKLVDPESVTIHGLAVAVNGFYADFIDRCIKENEEFARNAEADCYRENCKQNDKVSDFKLLSLYVFLEIKDNFSTDCD